MEFGPEFGFQGDGNGKGVSLGAEWIAGSAEVCYCMEDLNRPLLREWRVWFLLLLLLLLLGTDDETVIN